MTTVFTNVSVAVPCLLLLGVLSAFPAVDAYVVVPPTVAKTTLATGRTNVQTGSVAAGVASVTPLYASVSVDDDEKDNDNTNFISPSNAFLSAFAASVLATSTLTVVPMPSIAAEKVVAVRSTAKASVPELQAVVSAKASLNTAAMKYMEAQKALKSAEADDNRAYAAVEDAKKALAQAKQTVVASNDKVAAAKAEKGNKTDKALLQPLVAKAGKSVPHCDETGWLC